MFGSSLKPRGSLHDVVCPTLYFAIMRPHTEVARWNEKNQIRKLKLVI